MMVSHFTARTRNSENNRPVWEGPAPN